MRLSKTKIYNAIKIAKGVEVSTSDLLEKNGYIKQIQSGLFVQMNLMKRVINNIEKIVKEELEKSGCLEIGLNQLQSADIWKETGRYDTYGSEMFKLKDRSDKEMVFTGTNEELVTLVAKNYIQSYRDLSFSFYQINNKFRDEIRCNAGLIRSKEFLMMDAYSFHANKEQLEAEYDNIRNCYTRILDRLNLKYEIVKADSGEIGGSVSEEFVVRTSEGEIEVGHIFQLDTKYSEKMECQYVDIDNKKQNVVMGCYGIGISRLAQVLADSGRIGNCFNFATGISAYDYGIVVANVKDVAQMDAAEKMYKDLLSLGKTVYLDDRDLRFGEKLAEIEAIGTANKLLFGKNVTEGIYEVKQLSNDKWTQEKIF
jgi:prolyl-tRNA synthetase